HKNTGNLNNCIGFPLSLLQLKSEHQAGVFELAANRLGEIALLAEIARPDVAVITNVGPAHLQGFETLESVREEKGSIFSALNQEGFAIINRDDANIRVLEDRLRGKSISFGVNEQATVRAEHIFTRGEMGVSFTLKIGGLSRGIDMNILGVHNIYNALAAAASSWAINVPFEDICEGLGEFRQIRGRMSVSRLSSGVILIDDSYNANPASVAAALKTLATLKKNGLSIVIFGDMLELGDYAAAKHKEAGALMADTSVDMLFLMGEESGSVAEGAMEAGMTAAQIQKVSGPEEVLSVLREIPRHDLWILVKGSRAMGMERFAEAIMADQGTEEASTGPGNREEGS
ncbi:MAG: UDP-N-acetylmuramoyl-tripeptide--D-alanyl-D-alanine ligase, partial [Syntrophales bacterium]|nr:UDP-N-acetylmuramoyl-tripeptide--D-alanyl-D-alanine ligase [Syntrophales bacterium]